MKHFYPYKTADELGIAEWEREGLIKTIAVLEQENYSNFDMGRSCGTVCCIGGHVVEYTPDLARMRAGGFARYVFAQASYVEMNCSSVLGRLYFPDLDHCGRAWRATPKQGAQAIRNFLMTGRPDWELAMAMDG
jgi:hypothetical protein